MAACPVCGHDVDWVTANTAAQLLGVTPGRIRQFILAGRLPGAVKYQPPGGINAFWKIPAASVINLVNLRRDT